MKKYFLLMLLTVLTCGLSAQENQELKNVVSISPFRLLTGLRVKYEKTLNEKITYGGIFTGYYGSYPGVQLAPIVRFYFKGNAPEGFYTQAKIVGGFYQSSYTDVVLDGNSFPKKENGNYVYENKKQSFTSLGAGIAAGYQLFWGKDNRWSIDINFGIKIVGNVPEPQMYEWPDELISTGSIQSVFDNAGWYTVGPGSIVDGLISIGYRF